MQLAEKVGQMLLVGFQGLSAPDYILEWLASGQIGGVLLFARNIDTPQQVAALTRQVHEAAKYPALVAIDQEGGIVARLREGFTESPGAMALSASGDTDLARRMSAVLGAEMHALGINWNFAPVLDLAYNRQNPTVGTRASGSDTETVSAFATAAIEGFQSAGVAACAKHFPGLGDTVVDTHLALAVIDQTREALLAQDAVPYRHAINAGVASIMTTHTLFTALDSEYPATLSPTIVQTILRGDLGFEGVVATDCMEMRAISDHYGSGESAVLAALAGIDLVLVSHTRERQEAAYHAMLDAAQSGRLPVSLIDAAVARLKTLKEQFGITDTPDATPVYNPENQAVAQEAARAALVLLRGDDDLIPLKTDQRVQLVEFAFDRESEVQNPGKPATLGQRVQAAFPAVSITSLTQRNATPEVIETALQQAADSDVLILATRSSHLWETTQTITQQLVGAAQRVILLCLRNPYDAEILPESDVILCTCGDSAASLDAAVDFLRGDVTPTGTLPVSITLSDASDV